MNLQPELSNYYQLKYNNYKDLIEDQIKGLGFPKTPEVVYKPIRYALSSGGKRLRGVLLLLACTAVGGNIKSAINAAVAMEVLHNFTLVHDDIMDNAKLRRGQKTVYYKWDANVAILAGDEMIAQAYKLILEVPVRKIEILKVYTDALVQVCEGQGFDKEFECRKRVTISEYFKMILKKTGAVMSASTEIGALIGSGSTKDRIALRSYGLYLGRAFQIMDDYLDVMGNEKEFGKQIGGDIREGKKTYLLLKAMELGKNKDLKMLKSVVSGNRLSTGDIKKVINIYIDTGAIEAARREILRCTKIAKNSLNGVDNNKSKELLVWLADKLCERTS